MTTEQFNELINVISQLGENNYGVIDFLRDFLIPILSTGLAAFVAYEVAKLQIKNSEAQQKTHRSEELSNQKQFLIDELKIENAQKYISNKLFFTLNLKNMINYARRLSKEFEIHGVESEEFLKLDELINENSKHLESHITMLKVVLSLFDIKTKHSNDFDQLQSLVHKFHNLCADPRSFKSEEAEKTSQDCINIAHYFNNMIDKEMLKLLDSMKTDSCSRG